MWSLLDFLIGFFRNAYNLAVDTLDSNAGGLAGLGVYKVKVGDVNGGFFLHQTALGVLRGGLGGLGHHVDALYDSTALGALHLEHSACLALVLAGENADGIAFADIDLAHYSVI